MKSAELDRVNIIVPLRTELFFAIPSDFLGSIVIPISIWGLSIFRRWKFKSGLSASGEGIIMKMFPLL